MNGNTRIPALVTTIRSEAIEQVSGRMFRGTSFDDAFSGASHWGRPGTIGEMVAQYLNELSDNAYKTFKREVKGKRR